MQLLCPLQIHSTISGDPTIESQRLTNLLVPLSFHKTLLWKKLLQPHPCIFSLPITTQVKAHSPSSLCPSHGPHVRPHASGMKVKVLVAQSCLTLCNPMDCSLPGSSIHGIFQARILEWVTIPFSRGTSQPRDWTQISCIVGRFFTVWATREACLWNRVNIKEFLKKVSVKGSTCK